MAILNIPYVYTRAQVRRIIHEKFPNAQSKEGTNHIINHILWMMDRMETESEFITNREKAGRWIGWILGRMEAKKLLTNKETKHFIRQDINFGHAK